MAAPNRLGVPMFVFGTAEDIENDWNSSGTPVITASQTDPLAGTAAYLLNDDDGAAEEYVYTDNVALSPNADGEAIVSLFLKGGTASESQVRLYDATAAAYRHEVTVTWSGGVPSLATDTGSGTLFTPISVGGSWYLIRFSADSIVDGNNHRLEISPAGDTGSATGTVVAYVRSVVIAGYPIDSVNTWSEPREGTEFAKAASGLEDAWIVGTDEFLAGDIRWIPYLDIDSPTYFTGYDGQSEVVWVNTGWKKLFETGRTKTTLVFVPDRSDADVYHNVYLVEPMDGQPDLEPDMTRIVPIVLRDSDGSPFEGY